MKFTNENVSIEYCPLCRIAANMIATVARKVIACEDDRMKTVSTKTYHCGSCGSFVRSVDDEDAASANDSNNTGAITIYSLCSPNGVL